MVYDVLYHVNAAMTIFEKDHDLEAPEYIADRLRRAGPAAALVQPASLETLTARTEHSAR